MHGHMNVKLDQIHLTGNSWKQTITTFNTNPSVVSDMQHVN
jgi:hypothetical protein